MTPGERADLFLVGHGFASSRAEAQAAIRAGKVIADGERVRKPAQTLHEGMVIRYEAAHPFVSRGALKLQAALDHFALSPKGRICLDIGASTGGFTEVLLRNGAARVYAVDVGHGQLHARVAEDARVVSLEGVNARALTAAEIAEPVGAIVADVSFISLKLVLPSAFSFAAPEAWGVFLVKPQFEVGPDHIGRGGLVKDAAARDAAVAGIADFIAAQNWSVLGIIDSPVPGGDGNLEFLLGARRA